MDLDPQNYAFLDSLGWVYFKLGQYTLATQNLQKAVERSSTDPTVHDHLGQVYEKTGKLKLAVAQWERSMAEYSAFTAGGRGPGGCGEGAAASGVGEGEAGEGEYFGREVGFAAIRPWPSASHEWVAPGHVAASDSVQDHTPVSPAIFRLR